MLAKHLSCILNRKVHSISSPQLPSLVIQRTASPSGWNPMQRLGPEKGSRRGVQGRVGIKGVCRAGRHASDDILKQLHRTHDVVILGKDTPQEKNQHQLHRCDENRDGSFSFSLFLSLRVCMCLCVCLFVYLYGRER